MGKVIKLEDRRRPKEWMELTPKQKRENRRLQEQTFHILLYEVICCFAALGAFFTILAAALYSPYIGPEASTGLNLVSGFGWFCLGAAFLISLYTLFSTRRPGPPC